MARPHLQLANRPGSGDSARGFGRRGRGVAHLLGEKRNGNGRGELAQRPAVDALPVVELALCHAIAGVSRAESAHRPSSSGVGPTLAAFAVGRVNRGSFEWVAKDRFEAGLSGSPSRLQHTGDRLFKWYRYTSSTGIPPKFFPRNRVGTGPGNLRITSSAALASGSSVPISRTWKGSM
jgi:hypothetical protein